MPRILVMQSVLRHTFFSSSFDDLNLSINSWGGGIIIYSTH